MLKKEVYSDKWSWRTEDKYWEKIAKRHGQIKKTKKRQASKNEKETA